MAVRVATGVVGAPLALALVYAGGWLFGIGVAVIALVAQHELYRLARLGGARPQVAPGLALGALVALAPLVPVLGALAAAGTALLLAWSPFDRSDPQPLTGLSATVFGIIYPTAALATLTALRVSEPAQWPRGADGGNEIALLTMLVFLLVWATDTFAYFVGRSLGRHPLAPSVSPKKTWEGSIGGAVGALLVAAAFKAAWLPFLSWPDLAVLALICGVVSQLGDLAESRLKRAVGAKDSGALLPGHGGMLDRFDAMILAAPLVYLYVAFATDLMR